ncbi:FkbM family methyltransferase [Roseisalinus antarcticus]|uniref:23S rRNA (Uracil(1939)-C(5))-methyltransferase RlmD n=1 Tax=Roseisalinus antarcticus TaxID=254357 RepID=A0A1Y5RSC1_9RHOB|nr:FkbM family methyltransferase [Roseisalinus antarcticus]SLN23199.1 23S rRNA (uracil(1939)-C(5))-methyltransferase RlmD [Roseisalinus antarcticus]
MWRQLYTATRRTPLLKSVVWRMLPDEAVTLDGLTMHVHPRDNMTERHIWLHHVWPEPDSIAKLCAIVAARPCLVIDVGANCGAFTVPLARAAAPGSRVIAVEPNPAMVARLAANLDANGLADRVEIVQRALDAQDGSATLTLHARNLGQSSLGTPKRPGQSLTVAATTLAGLIADSALPVVVKIDIEGHEDTALWPLLTGARHLPEVFLLETQHAAQWSHDLVARLSELGYDQTYSGEGNTLFHRSPSQQGPGA